MSSSASAPLDPSASTSTENSATNESGGVVVEPQRPGVAQGEVSWGEGSAPSIPSVDNENENVRFCPRFHVSILGWVFGVWVLMEVDL